MSSRSNFAAIAAAFILIAAGQLSAQIPNQLAQDLEAGRVPTRTELAQFEKEAAAQPTDLRLTRKLGKAYFFQFFGDNDESFVPKAQKTLERALTIDKDDAETMVYLGSLHVLQGQRLLTRDPAKQKAAYDKGFELVKKAESLAPRHGAVLSVASATYLYLPDSYGMAPHVVEMLEGMIQAIGPMFEKFAHHGQQRLLLTLGQAYIRTGKPEKARPLFEKALKVDEQSDEAFLLKDELSKLKAKSEK
jgi:tetratricopeptide (TPR) repeat protein